MRKNSHQPFSMRKISHRPFSMRTQCEKFLITFSHCKNFRTANSQCKKFRISFAPPTLNVKIFASQFRIRNHHFASEISISHQPNVNAKRQRSLNGQEGSQKSFEISNLMTSSWPFCTSVLCCEELTTALWSKFLTIPHPTATKEKKNNPPLVHIGYGAH